MNQHKEYNKLLDMLEWHFEAIDAMQIVRQLVRQGKTKPGAYRRLAIMAGEAESDLREMIK